MSKKILPKTAVVSLFSQETVDSLYELGSVYAKIRRRLLSEGYIIKDGRIIPPKNKLNETRR